MRFLYLTILLAAALPTLADKPVLRWIHGIGSLCIIENFTFKKHFKDFDAKCIESGMGWVGSFQHEVEKACAKLEQERDVLSKGFTLIGNSQGGLIARAVVESCSIGAFVKRLVTLGGPHQGVAIVPFTDPNSSANYLIRLCEFDFFKSIVGPCGYIRDVRNPGYDRIHNTVKNINNEYEQNEEYKERIKGLDLFMAIGFGDDKMIQPKNTAVFGFYENSSYNSYVDMEQLEIYQKDSIGLRELNESGRLFRCIVDGDHLQIDEEDLKLLVVDVANWQTEDYKKNFTKMAEKCKFIVPS